MMEGFLHWLTPVMTEYGAFGLGVLSFTESFIQPVPVVLLLGAMQGILVAAGEYSTEAFWFLILVVYVTNCLGAFVGYALGKYLGRPVVIRLFGQERFDRTSPYVLKYGNMGVFFAAVTPIPFKVATWLAGIAHLPFLGYCIAVVVGRAIHLALYAGVILLGLEILSWAV